MLGQACIRLENWTGAIEAADAAIELAPDDHKAPPSTFRKGGCSGNQVWSFAIQISQFELFELILSLKLDKLYILQRGV